MNGRRELDGTIQHLCCQGFWQRNCARSSVKSLAAWIANKSPAFEKHQPPAILVNHVQAAFQADEIVRGARKAHQSFASAPSSGHQLRAAFRRVADARRNAESLHIKI